MEEAFKKNKYFSFLINEQDGLDKERIEFNDNITELLSKKTDELGTII